MVIMKSEKLCLAAIPLLMIILNCAVAPAAEREVILDIAVTNPSAEDSQDILINADLPEELKKGDVVNTDGLELKFNSGTGCLSVEGKVNLQPSETTFFYIKTRDVWVIPAEEIRKVKAEASGYPEIYTPALAKKLDDMMSGKDLTGESSSAHIALYRKDVKELERIRSELRAAKPARNEANSGKQAAAYAVLLIAVAAISVFIIFNKNMVLSIVGRFRKFMTGERRKFVRLPNNVQAKCRSIDQNEAVSFRPASNISNGGVAVYLEKPYKPNSLVELEVKIPDTEKPLTFNGFVVWLQKTVGPDKKEAFLTGISFAEAAQGDLESLKEYIASRSKK